MRGLGRGLLEESSFGTRVLEFIFAVLTGITLEVLASEYRIKRMRETAEEEETSQEDSENSAAGGMIMLDESELIEMLTRRHSEEKPKSRGGKKGKKGRNK